MSMKKLVMSALQMDEEIVLPDEYVQCDHIASSGQGQFINLGMPLTADHQIEISCSISDDGKSAHFLFANMVTTDRCFSCNIANYPTGSATHRFGRSKISSVIYRKGDMTIRMGRNGLTVDSLVGMEYYPYDKDPAYFETNGNVYIFAGNYGSSVQYYTSGCIYYVKVYKNGELVARMIPAVRLDGRPGLYDIVRKTFHMNIGTGSFTYVIK